MSESWLLLISNLDRDERLELELRLKELESALERVRAQDMQQHFAGASVE